MKTNFVIILLIFSSQIFAAEHCQNLFQKTSVSAAYQDLKEQYNKPSSQIRKKGYKFESELKQYLQSLKDQNENKAVDIANDPQFIQMMSSRLFVLLRRPVSADFSAKEISAIAQIDAIKSQTGSFQELRANKSIQLSNLQEKRLPKIDKENITGKADVKSWSKASAIVEKLAMKPNQKMNMEDISMIIAAIKGMKYPMDFVDIIDQLVPSFYINFMFTLEKNGEQTLDPTNSFIGGRGKYYLVEQLLDLINRNPNNLHPIVLSAYVRQMTVSIHPSEDGNGRLARILSDYVLMKHGYLPAFIPKSTETENRSVALFTYKNFEDQISPEETRMIQLNGVMNSYQNFSKE